jgi:MFS family permease
MGAASGIARARIFRALYHPNFRLYFAAFFANQIGFWVANIALQGVMVELSGNDPLQIGLLFFCLFSPALLFAPVAGVIADRFDRRRVMLICFIGVALTSGFLAFLSAKDLLAPAVVLFLAFLMGLGFCLAGPASQAIAANMVHEEELGSAISLQSVVNNLTRVIGPSLAAPLIAAHRFAVAFAIFTVSSALASVLIARIRLPPFVGEKVTEGMFARVQSGWAHARERTPALDALLTASVLSFFGVAHTALIPPFAEEVLAAKDAFAWIFAATGVGAIAGAVATGFLRRPSILLATSCLFLYGGALVGFGASRSVAAALIMEAIVGFFYFAVMTSVQTLLQQIVDDSKRGRVMSLFMVAWGGLFPLGALTMGAAARYVGISTAIIGAGVICSAVGAVLSLRLRRLS